MYAIILRALNKEHKELTFFGACSLDLRWFASHAFGGLF